MSSDPHARVRAWRYPVAAAAVVTAATHVLVTEDHFREAPYIGALFVALEVVSLSLAVLLVRRDARGSYVAAATVGALTIAAYAYSRAFGLPQIHDDVGRWTEPLGLVAASAEAVLIVGGLAGGLGIRASWSLSRPVAVLSASALLVTGLAATVYAADREPGMPDTAGGMGTGVMGIGGMGTASMSMQGSTYWDDVDGGAFRSDGVTRTYYIQAEVVEWNYVPDGINDITGEPFDETAALYTVATAGRIGSTYEKCLYRGYTDDTFGHQTPIPPDDAYLGFQGPVIHVVVGDTVRVVFRNTCPFPTSVHPHGVFYEKDSEGAPYNDGTSGEDTTDDAVATGEGHTYTWLVPDRAGPGPNDPSSIMWMYHSHTDEVADTYAGLTGPIVVTRSGLARADGTPRDVDREIFALFTVDNENLSPLLDENIARYVKPSTAPGSEEDFEESNLKHSINGYLYGNMPMITVKQGERVRWYAMSMGTETDLHTPHWHGNTVLVTGMRMDVVSLLPASMVVADMVPDDVGVWLFHCHVNDHILAGMITRYQVVPA